MRICMDQAPIDSVGIEDPMDNLPEALQFADVDEFNAISDDILAAIADREQNNDFAGALALATSVIKKFVAL